MTAPKAIGLAMLIGVVWVTSSMWRENQIMRGNIEYTNKQKPVAQPTYIPKATSSPKVSPSTTSKPATTKTPTAKPVVAEGGVVVKSHSKRNQYERDVVVGEVVNNTGKPVQNVKVTATFYDASGSVIDTGFDYAGEVYSDIAPGATVPFEILSSTGTNSSDYKLSINY